MSNLNEIEKKIGIKFKNQDLLQQAFVHRSYLNENKDFKLDHNERLEFLGDACMELIVTDYLYNNYPNPEGELTNWRAALVRGTMISKIAKELGYESHLLLSRGESRSTGKARELILANTFEAVLGAIYLDQGYEAAGKFIKKYLIPYLPEIISKELYYDPKSKFQEIAQEKVGITPIYKVEKESGPDHAKVFVMGVYLEDKKIADGTGSSKQAAEQEAARIALDIWQENL
ncbi:MAG TPA: ribonuclease III [Patescibacteria group bacterium]|nr:ribonuclease III [Patescibacteria group bacterium]